MLQAKKHPPNVKYSQYKEVPETDNIVQEDLELPTSCIGMRITIPFKDGFFPGIIIDKFTVVKDDERIQKWKCQFDDGKVCTNGFDKLMQGMTYQKIYPFGMTFENDKFMDEKKIKHPTTPDKTCEVDEDDKPEIASQAPSKSPFQPISNKYKDNIDPTKPFQESQKEKERCRRLHNRIYSKR